MAKGNRGGKGGSGGGDEGTGAIKRDKGAKVGEILSSTSMISMRENKRSEVDEALGVLRDVGDKYKTSVSEAFVTKIKGGSAVAFYASNFDTVSINSSFFDSKKMNSAYDEMVKIGYHPSRGNKTGMEATVAHELGHKLTADAMEKLGAKNFDEASNMIVKEARKSTSHRGVVQMSNAISRYATASNSEAIAEAFSDVYCNGAKAKQESHAIVNTLEKYL